MSSARDNNRRQFIFLESKVFSAIFWKFVLVTVLSLALALALAFMLQTGTSTTCYDCHSVSSSFYELAILTFCSVYTCMYNIRVFKIRGFSRLFGIDLEACAHK